MARYAPENSPWKKRVLLPFWILRDLVTILLIASYALILATINEDPYDTLEDNFSDREIKSAKAVVAVYMSLFAVSLLLDVYCMIRAARHSLSPRTFLIINVLQTAWWTVVLILVFIGNAAYGRAFVSIFTIVCFALYLGLLIYAGVIFHRDRRARRTGGAYSATANPANHLSAQEYGQTNYTGYGGGVPTYDQSSPYNPYTESYAPRAQELKPVPMPPQQQYNHQATEYYSPSSVGATPISPQSPNNGGYVIPPPHPSVSPAPTSPLPPSHPSTGQGPYVLPPPMKGGAAEMPDRH